MQTALQKNLALTLFPVAEESTREAGALALAFFRHGQSTSARTWSKAGNSLVTEADVAADVFLKERLCSALPEAAWLSEETADDRARLGEPLVWIVDPIDGTRAFAAGLPDWCVAVALLSEGQPILGLVYAPALGLMYEATLGAGARLDGVALTGPSSRRLDGARVAGPKPLIDALEHRAGPLQRLAKVPSLALRLARVADGSIDMALVSKNSHDWDLAAADLILREAGARLTDLSGEAPLYNQAEPSHAELIATSAHLHPRAVLAMAG